MRSAGSLQTITSRFGYGYQAQWLNVHVEFPLLQRALPSPSPSARSDIRETKIHDVRVIRLFEVLCTAAPHVGGWTAKQIHQSSSPPSISPSERLRPETNCATTCANSRGTD